MITPNSGKLQHHLGLLGNDKDRTNEELHSVDYLVNRSVLWLCLFSASVLIFSVVSIFNSTQISTCSVFSSSTSAVLEAEYMPS